MPRYAVVAGAILFFVLRVANLGFRYRGYAALALYGDQVVSGTVVSRMNRRGWQETTAIRTRTGVVTVRMEQR
jgi:hypothetical protein